METTPLLGARPPPRWLPFPHTRKIHIHPAFYIFPIPFFAQLSIQSQATTVLEIIRGVICRVYWEKDDADGPPGLEDPRCLDPRVGQLFSTFMTVNGVLTAICIFIMYGAMNHYTRKRSVRFVLIALSSVLTFANALFVLALFSSSNIQVPILVAWFVVSVLFVGAPDLWMLPCSAHIINTTNADQRTSYLSLNYGAFLSGGIPAFALGGAITEKYGSPKPTFIIATAFSAILVLYCVFILPESSGPKDDSSSSGSSTPHEETQHEEGDSVWKRMWGTVYTFIILPLGVLLPRREASLYKSSETGSTISVNNNTSASNSNGSNKKGGKRNYRLFLLGLHILFANLSSSYIVSCVIIFLTTTREYRPDDNGYLLSLLLLASAISLLLVTPALLKLLRPLYDRYLIGLHPNAAQIKKSSTSSSAHGRSISGRDIREEQEQEQEDSGGKKEKLDEEYPSTKLEVHITMLSWVLEIVTVVALPYSRSAGDVLVLMMLYGVSAARQPTTRTICVASAAKRESGDILTATSMLSSIGAAMSTFVLGSTLSGTMTSSPTSVFWLSGALGAVAAFILFFIRDNDRYYPVHGEEEEEEERDV